MNRTLKKALASILAMLLLLTAAPLAGFTEIDLPDIDFGFTAKAATQGDFDYSVSNGEAQITDYRGSAEVLAIPSEIDGYPVTSIGDSAFANCGNLTSVTIPDSVTNIGDSAFANCDNLTSVTIPDSVTSIGGAAFCACYSLTSITIPDSVTNIGDSAFANCDNLTSITIPDSVTSIGASAFDDCYNLTSITIPDSITSIGISAFYNCYSLTSITIPDSVTSIGDAAFFGCDSLNSVIIPDSVTSIGNYAFSSCDSLTKITVDPDNECYASSADGILYNKDKTTLVCYPFGKTETTFTIPDSVTSIGNYAFYNCENLTSITIPNSVTSIGYSAFAFYNCSNLTSVHISDIAAWCKIAFGDSYSNPLYYAKKLYLNDELVTELVIPDGVTSIGIWAFYNCDSLSSVTVPDSVTSIGSSAFYGTAYYVDANNWENNVLYIGNHLIEAKTELSGAYTVKEGTRTIADSAFYNCDSLTSITIPDSVTSIGDYAFYNCENLTSVHISDIAAWCGIAFGNAYSNPLYYAKKLYLNNELVTDLVIPDGVTSIGASAFSDCNNLTSITIPDSVTSIGSSAFYGTAYVVDANNWENNVLYIGNHLINAESELSGAYTVKEGTRTIADDAFYNCDYLTSITIPDSVTSIGDSAFKSCNKLSSVTIPDSVTSIGDYAFYTYSRWASSSLTSVTILNPNCAVYDSSDTISSTATIYGYDNSTAQEYAEKYSRTFVSLSTAPEDRFDGTTAFVKDNALIGLADTTVQNILQQAGNGATLKKADGTAKKADEKIGTGDKLVLPDGTEMILSVLGDLNGDGEIATADARLALRKAVNLETFTDAQNTAACVDGGAVVEVAHARKILRASVNLEKAEDWFKVLAK